MISFEKLMALRSWREIRNCPGRYLASDILDRTTVSDLLGVSVTETTRVSPRARDAVIVTPLEDGGLISYKREDGTYLHTLNTPEGFERKLADLDLTI